MAPHIMAPGAMFKTAAPLAPMLANTTSLQLAMRQNTVGIGYAGAGFLLFYYVGVSKVLQQIGVIKPGHTKTAASSAGILSAAIDHGFATHDQFLATGKAFAARCRAKHNCAGVLSEEVQKTAEQLAPSDAAARLSGVGYIALSSPNVLGVPVGHYVVNYTSREDVVSAVTTGVYLPMWSGPTMTTPYRGKNYYDGAFRTPLPCPLGNTTYCVKVNVLPPWGMRDVAFDAKQPHSWAALTRVLNSTLNPNPGEFLAAALKAQLERPEERQDDVITGWAAFMLNQPPGDIVDIYPGKYNKNPYSLVEWMSMILAPPADDHIDRMVAMGAVDARSWATQVGLLTAGAAPARRRA